MEAISEYLLSVTGAAILCAVVMRLLDGKGSAATVAKMLTGMFLALTVLTPLTNLRLSDALDLLPQISADAREAVAEGEASTKNALRQGITAQVEAYILDKAERLGLSLAVEVELSKDAIPVPIRVRLRGNASPYAKQKLQAILRDDLGIEKENQIWT